MNKIIAILFIVALTVMSGLAQTLPRIPLAPANCDGERYRVIVAGDVLESSANLKRWEKFKKANYPLGNRGDLQGGKYSAMIYQDDVLCVPFGMELGEFLEYDTYGPAVIRILPGTEFGDTSWGRILSASAQHWQALAIAIAFGLAGLGVWFWNSFRNPQLSGNATARSLDEFEVDMAERQRLAELNKRPYRSEKFSYGTDEYSTNPYDFGKPAPPRK